MSTNNLAKWPKFLDLVDSSRAIKFVIQSLENKFFFYCDSIGQSNTNNTSNKKYKMIPLSLFETLELLPLFPLTPKHAVQVEDMSGADAMAPLLRQEKTMFIQDRTSFRTPSFNLP
ncbi:hypothetical protein JHK86_047708 [Glycine max]|nr:hypothetical protein JHK86_047708 [Glycine max]